MWLNARLRKSNLECNQVPQKRTYDVVETLAFQTPPRSKGWNHLERARVLARGPFRTCLKPPFTR